METKHTKGTWKIENGIIKSNYECIAFVAILTERIDETILNGESWLDMMNRIKPDRIKCQNEQEANAKLIAAAPELLEALIISYNTLKATYPLYDEWVEASIIRNAIKKATE